MPSFISMNGFIVMLSNSLSVISSRSLLLRNIILGWAEFGGDMSCFVVAPSVFTLGFAYQELGGWFNLLLLFR